MTAQHTPGPWEATGNLVRSPMAKELGSGVMLAECSDRWFVKVNSDEAKANARLIAKAPEMLEALKDAYPYIADDALRERLGNLIADATGVQA